MPEMWRKCVRLHTMRKMLYKVTLNLCSTVNDIRKVVGTDRNRSTTACLLGGRIISSMGCSILGGCWAGEAPGSSPPPPPTRCSRVSAPAPAPALQLCPLIVRLSTHRRDSSTAPQVRQHYQEITAVRPEHSQHIFHGDSPMYRVSFTVALITTKIINLQLIPQHCQVQRTF